MPTYAIVLGSCSFPESQEKDQEKSGSTKAHVKEQEAQRWKGICFIE